MKNSSLNLQDIKNQAIDLGKQVMSYHLLIATFALLGFAIAVVIQVNYILSNTTDEEYQATQQQTNAISTKFDEETIEKIENLRTSQDNSNLGLPGGKRNPFVE